MLAEPRTQLISLGKPKQRKVVMNLVTGGHVVPLDRIIWKSGAAFS
jgi:hypothetical protein